jgi:hypothetical protein
MQSQEITLKVSSRPLRCAYLVYSREDVLDAVTLYTHVWGGTANAIFPNPASDTDLAKLKYILQIMNPDYIFIPRDAVVSDELQQTLQSLPIQRNYVSKEEIQNHVQRETSLRLSDGRLCHIEEVLASRYPNGRLVNVHLIESGSNFNFEVALNFGLLSSVYRNGLTRFFNSTIYSAPTTIDSFLKTALASSKFRTPPYLTMANTGRSHNFLDESALEINDEKTLCLFLDDGVGTEVSSSFWNCRWIDLTNKIFLPKVDFLDNLENCISLIVEFMPNLRAISITISAHRDEAAALYHRIKTAFSQREYLICVNIIYVDLCYNWLPGKVYSSKNNIYTRSILSDGCVRFEVATPDSHENTDFQFGYDLEFKLKRKHFFIPNNLVSSKLLTNSIQRIELAESNEQGLGDLWLERYFPIRANYQGVSGIALSGRENQLYIHPEHTIIIQQLKEFKVEVKPNKHTRYAQGLVKRLGGIEIVATLLRKGGADIISVLVADKSEFRGLSKSRLLSALINKRSYSQQDAKQAIDQKLSSLLEHNLLSRGYCLECPVCSLKNWFSLEEAREFVECKGCAENFQLSLNDAEFVFKPNELAAQLVQEGGLAVITTALLLRKISLASSSYLQFGGDLFQNGSNKNFAEVDLFWLTESGLVISECKSFFFSSNRATGSDQEIEEKIDRVRESLSRNIESAKLINAKIIILGIHSNLSEIPGLFDAMAPLVERASEEGIGLHLALNGNLHPLGKSQPVEPREVKVESLLSHREQVEYEYSVGEVPQNFGWSVGVNGRYSKAVLEIWDAELKQELS